MCFQKCLNINNMGEKKQKSCNLWRSSHSALGIFSLNFPLKSRIESHESEAYFSAALLPLLAPSQQCAAQQSSGSGRNHHNCLFKAVVSARPCANQLFSINHGRRRRKELQN